MSGSGLNNLYISTVDLEEYFVSNQSALSLAGGKIYFYVDSNRTQPKQIYELVQASGYPYNYTYVPLPNPITLSNSGTPMDANGNNVAIYYYPYDPFNNVQLYYVECYDSMGNLQFTREAWPFPYAGTGGGGGGGSVSGVGVNNQLTNPQFAQVLFNPTVPLVITYSGSSVTSVAFAPGWTINITHVGSGSLTLTQTAVAGTNAYPYNPPYVLTVASGSNVTNLTIVQTLNNNPDWAAPQISGVMGFLSGSILLGTGTGVTMQYVPSSGNPAQTILSATNTSGAFSQQAGTIQLLPANNPQTGAVGYDQIVLSLLNTSGTSVIGNVQVIPLTTNVSGVQYDQTPVNRQYDQMFNYYNSRLQYKPIPSYLVGWDFPLNPAQFLGSSVSAQAVGANNSYYAWDQTILYQSTNSGITTSRGANGELVLTAAATGQMAVIQYLSGTQINQILNSRLSVNVEAKTSKSAGYTATVSLWYTKGTALPSCVASNLSIVMGLNTTGYPVTFNQPTGGTWLPVPRSGLGNTTGATGGSDAQFTIQKSSTTNFFEYGFSGWDMQGVTDTGAATFFAIVLGTASITNADSISINSISLVPGDIPTRPAAQTPTQVLQNCQYYYEMSFNPGTVPAQALGVGHGEIYFGYYSRYSTSPTGTNILGAILFKTTKYANPTTVTLYNPVNANAFVNDINVNVDWANSTVPSANCSNFYITATTAPEGISYGDTLTIQYTADSRLAQ